MSGYSIFEGTIVDMTWPEVEEAVKKEALMLIPVGVIEQHGPHLPLGTDIYAASLMCSLIKAELEIAGAPSVIAPPYYFGINWATAMFPGSISIRKGTMISVLSDLFGDYARHGFKRQFILNHHGDPEHNDALIQAVLKSRERAVDAVLIVAGLVKFAIERACEKAALPLSSPAVLEVRESDETSEARERLNRSELHIHAEERETSMIMRWYPELLNREGDIPSLKAVLPSYEEFISYEFAGKWRELSPHGHIGDPSVATKSNGELYQHESRDIAASITDFLASQKG